MQTELPAGQEQTANTHADGLLHYQEEGLTDGDLSHTRAHTHTHTPVHI